MHEQGNHEEAVQLLEQYVRLETIDNPLAYYKLGISYREIGNINSARFYLDKTIATLNDLGDDKGVQKVKSALQELEGR